MTDQYDQIYETDPNPFAPPKTIDPAKPGPHPSSQAFTPAYLYTALNHKRHKVSNWIEAPTADAAVSMLTEQGFSEIILHIDDLAAFFAPHPQLRTPPVTRAWIDLRTVGGFFPLLWYWAKSYYRRMYIWFLIVIAVLFLNVYQNKPFGFFEYFLFFWMLFPLVQAVFSAMNPTSRKYYRLLDAIYWARWKSALKLVDSLTNKIPRAEFILRRSQILAGLKQMEEALRTASLLRDELRAPDWFSWARMTEVHSAAGDRQSAIHCLDRAIELAPCCAALYIDRSRFALSYEENVELAESLMHEAKRHAICDIHLPVVKYQDSMIRFEKGDCEGVRKLFCSQSPNSGNMRKRHRRRNPSSIRCMPGLLASRRNSVRWHQPESTSRWPDHGSKLFRLQNSSSAASARSAERFRGSY